MTVDAIDTDHLSMRPFRTDDVDAAHSWFGDSIVMHYTPAGADATPEKTRARLENYQAHQHRHGFSKWIVLERASGHPIGDAGLLILEDEGWIDLGFRFAQHCWGKGFATEVASAWISVASQRLRLDRLGAFVHPQNASSIRVIEKIGFRRTGHRMVLGMSAVCFDLKLQGPG